MKIERTRRAYILLRDHVQIILPMTRLPSLIDQLGEDQLQGSNLCYSGGPCSMPETSPIGCAESESHAAAKMSEIYKHVQFRGDMLTSKGSNT